MYDSGAIIYSFPDVRDCWENETALDATVNWNFTSSVFDQWNQKGTKKVSFKRNTLTTITVSCTPDNSSGPVCINEEAIGEDNKIYLCLNSDGVIVIGVEPSEGEDD